ncbi:hypothetical protein CDD81_3301 [Ophiocordyceps australis]|uniref:Myb-like DNA-binding domain-containing protein n=1 Tax=Ophiocordyceps australis TaxID=1399860 RepID=A0A2C5YCI0_9HYPO|nr:hypothetical protein CDD81_3301 [Ophiocordyceps australis]
MPSSAKTPTMAGRREPTSQDAMFFFAIVKHMKNKAEVDWNAVAAEQRLKNAEVAKVRFGQIKRKLGISSTGDGPTTPTSKASRTPKKRGVSLIKTPPADDWTSRIGAKPEHSDEEAEKREVHKDNDPYENNEEHENTKSIFGPVKREEGGSDFGKNIKEEESWVHSQF